MRHATRCLPFNWHTGICKNLSEIFVNRVRWSEMAANSGVVMDHCVNNVGPGHAAAGARRASLHSHGFRGILLGCVLSLAIPACQSLAWCTAHHHVVARTAHHRTRESST